MAVKLENSQPWQLNPFLYFALFIAIFIAIILSPRSSSSSPVFDLSPSPSLHRPFFILFAVAAVLQGLGSVFGEYEFVRNGFGGEEMGLCLAVGAAVSAVVGTLFGMLSDVMGPKKSCLLFFILHLFVSLLKSLTKHSSVWVATICLSLASSLFSFCFETWIVIEHEKQGHKQDLLNDTFWLMTFFECASLISSQGIANLLVKDLQNALISPFTLAALIAFASILYIRKEWSKFNHVSVVGSYKKSFSAHVLRDKRIWVLSWAQASIHFSMSIFWILWAPFIVMDGREVNLSILFPCFIASRMLGSAVFPWFCNGVSSLQNEDCLAAALGIAGLVLSIVAYDYQEIGLLVLLFCIFHASLGLSTPILARLRTMYLPNELRSGMISFSLAPANAMIMFVLLQGGYQRSIENSTIMAFAALSLLSAAGCIYLLKRWKRQQYQNRRSL